MKYRQYGKTGSMISTLGFGCMRFPMKNETTVDRDLAIPMLEKAYELGVNYFDTGKWYCAGDSEVTLGEAIKSMDRDKITVSTKYAMEEPTAADMRQKFETSLKLLDQEYVDYYHLWGISWKEFTEKIDIPGGPLETFVKLKEEGLVRHLSFSFHSEPEEISKLVDTGIFESMLCQYNLLDRKNEEGIAYAASKGLGVAIMGPVGGGRLGAPSEAMGKLLPGQQRTSSAELALRFVLTNPNVTLALSGMSELSHVIENAALASKDAGLSTDELEQVERSAAENQKMMDLYCTGCKYCMPCPHDVNIPHIFEAMNYYKVWDLKDHAKSMYEKTKDTLDKKGLQADACGECGECEEKCPQKIPIIEQLKESHAALSV